MAILLIITLLGAGAFAVRQRQGLPSKRSVAVLLKEARKAVVKKRWEQAISIVKSLVDHELGGSEARMLHAQILRAIHLPKEALQAAAAGLARDPKHLGLLLEKGKALLRLGRAQPALDALGQCVPILRDEDDCLDLASALFQTGRMDEAWRLLESRLRRTRSGRLVALAGDILFLRGESIDAARLYLRASHLGWHNRAVTLRLGVSLLEGRVPECAEGFFRRILDKDSSDLPSILGYGRCLELRGDNRLALQLYQSGEEWDRGNPALLRQAGFCAARTQRYEHAELYLEAARSRGETSPKVLALLAYSRERQEKWKQAEASFCELVARYPEHPAGYRGVAWLCGIGRNVAVTPVQGVAMAERALLLKPDVTSWELLSACEARIGNFNKAHEIQEKLAEQEGDDHHERRRRSAMRALRKGRPLDASMMRRPLVA